MDALPECPTVGVPVMSPFPPQVIYTIRNPKDVLVSLYHFAQMFHPFKDPGSLDQFLEEFLKGDGECWGMAGEAH